MKIFSVLTSIALGVVLFGCATRDRLAESEGQGTRLVYGASFDPVWRAAMDAARHDGLEITSSDRTAGYIAARHPQTLGEDVGIWVRPTSTPAQTEVEVLTRQPGSSLTTDKTRENDIQRTIAANLSPPVYGTAPRDVYIERQTVVPATPPEPPATVVVPTVSTAEREQVRRLDALRVERDRREQDLRTETDAARREAIGREMSILDSDIRLEEQRLRDIQRTR